MKILLPLAISYISLLSIPSLVLAQSPPVPVTVNQTQTVSFQPPLPPTTEPAPGGRVRGGAKRGLCPSLEPQLTALVPYTQKDTVTNVWGLTTEAQPTLMFYMPYTRASGYATEFVLQADQNKKAVYSTAIALPEKPGIISITLPKQVSLAVNQRYRWFLTVDCDPEPDSSLTYVEGVIKRVNLSRKITQQLKTATPVQQFDIYLQNGIWHEALKMLWQLRQEKPQDPKLQEKWQVLLSTIRLDDVASQPLISSKP